MWDIEEDDPPRRLPTREEIRQQGLVEYEGSHYSLGSADPVRFYEKQDREPKMGEM